MDKVADFISTCDVADRCVTCSGMSTPIFGLVDHARCYTAMHDENSFEYKVHRAMDKALDEYRFRPEGLMMDEYNRMACKHHSAIIDTSVRYPPYLTFPKTESADASTMNRALDKLVEDLKSEQVDIQIIKHPTNTIISLESADNHCQRTRLLTLFAASRLKAAALHTPSLLGDVYGSPTWRKGGQTLKKTELIPGDGTLHKWGARFTELDAQGNSQVPHSLQLEKCTSLLHMRRIKPRVCVPRLRHVGVR